VSPGALANTPDVLEAAELRFGQVGIANVRVRSSDPAALREALEVRLREAPRLLERAPVVVDLSFLSPRPTDATVKTLLQAIRGAGMLPVGIAWGDSVTEELARQLDLPLVAKFRAEYERTTETGPDADNAHQAPAAAGVDIPKSALQHHHPVRTGQQVYARGTDLVVVGTVANGAEVLADGNIHIYGTLRGRAFAGAQGAVTCRIFCGEFRPEIVSIAGHYRVFEELPAEFDGHPVQVWLDAGKLQMATL
jgi:septum site-determining protein MinC